MAESSNSQQAENPIEDTKTAVKATQTTAKGLKMAARLIKLARSFTPAGAALLLKDIAQKVPVGGGLIKKAGDLIKKLAAGAAIAAGYLLALLLSKIAALVGAGIGAIIGFAVAGPVGAVIGGAIGAVVGPQLISFLGNFAGLTKAVTGSITQGIGSVASGIGNAVSGIFSSAGSFLGGLASGTMGALGSVANFLTGLGSLTFPTSIVTVPLAAGLGSVGLGTLVTTAFFAPAAFFTNSGDGPPGTAGQNEYFTVTKTANPDVVPNQTDGFASVEFTITVTARETPLATVQIFDVARGGPGGSISLPTPSITCPSPMAANEVCVRTFTLGIDSRFNDSIVNNTVTVIAHPQGQSDAVSTIASATVTVGSPSSQCPNGWPVISSISQGPEGHYQYQGQWRGHGDLGYEALDMGTGSEMGRPVYATVDGVAHIIPQSGPNGTRPMDDQRIYITPTGCPNLGSVNYWHLSSVLVNEGDIISWGQQIATSGINGTGPHIHYQFNEQNNRSFRIENPYVPITVVRNCGGIDGPDCNVIITTAP